MPTVGDVLPASVVGKYYSQTSNPKYVWAGCHGCGKERWVRFVKGKPESEYCHTCAAEKYQTVKDN